METLYRKVAVSERLPTKTGMHMVIFKNNKVGKFNFWDEEAFKESWNEYVNYWLEEIPNTSQQIEKLEADKAELVELLKIFVEENTPITTSHAYEFPEYMMKAKSLIQKYK